MGPVTSDLAERYSVGLVIGAHNRSDYLRRTLGSLSQSDLPDTVILLIDDASDDPVASRLLREYRHPSAPVIHVIRTGFSGDAPRPMTVRQNLTYGWSFLSHRFEPRYLANLDADVVVQRDWMRRLVSTYPKISQRDGRVLLSAYHAPTHRTEERHPAFARKASLGGAQLFFAAETLGEVERAGRNPRFDKGSHGWDWDVIYHLGELDYRFYALRPSAVQHIGVRGLNSCSLLTHDAALDYRSLDPRLSGWSWRTVAAIRSARDVCGRLRDRMRPRKGQ